jgi:hypothetical protein
MYNWFNRISPIFIVVFLLLACKQNEYDIDTSSVSITPIEIQRLDRDIFDVNVSNIESKIETLKQKYGSFHETYLVEMLNNGGYQDSSVKFNLLNFVKDENIKACEQAVQKQFSDDAMKMIAQDLTAPMQRLKFHFPNLPQPKLVSFISGWNYGAWYSDNTLGIGLDMYLGEQNEFYKMLGWPLYLVKKCDKKNIVPECMKAVSMSLVKKPEQMNDLLDHMVYYGKLQFLSDVLLPDYTDSLKFNYSTKDMQYLEKYERNIWLFLTEKNRLFDQDPNEIVGYINDGPFTGAISKDCPPRIGIWVGRQIIKAYMKTTKAGINSLLAESDSKKILQLAKYKP